jgi:dethiobiotin synthetase
VTGTDTEVGKTLVTAALGHALTLCKVDIVAIKPVESGTDLGLIQDGVLLAQATGQTAPTQALTLLKTPVAPPVAADLEGVKLDARLWIDAVNEASKRHHLVLVEGAGGLMSPLTWNHTLLDLAVGWKSDAILVASDKLGCLNHTLLTLSTLTAAGIRPLGVIFNAPKNPDLSTGQNAAALARFYPTVPTVTLPRVQHWRDAVPMLMPLALALSK